MYFLQVRSQVIDIKWGVSAFYIYMWDPELAKRTTWAAPMPRQSPSEVRIVALVCGFPLYIINIQKILFYLFIHLLMSFLELWKLYIIIGVCHLSRWINQLWNRTGSRAANLKVWYPVKCHWSLHTPDGLWAEEKWLSK